MSPLITQGQLHNADTECNHVRAELEIKEKEIQTLSDTVVQLEVKLSATEETDGDTGSLLEDYNELSAKVLVVTTVSTLP